MRVVIFQYYGEIIVDYAGLTLVGERVIRYHSHKRAAPYGKLCPDIATVYNGGCALLPSAVGEGNGDFIPVTESFAVAHLWEDS